MFFTKKYDLLFLSARIVSRLLIGVTVIALAALVIDRAGPYRGWMQRTFVVDDKTPSTQPPETETTDSVLPEPPLENSSIVENDGDKVDLGGGSDLDDAPQDLEDSGTAIQEARREGIYESLRQKHLDELWIPSIGEDYLYRLENGNVIYGKLVERTEEIIRVELDIGTIDLPYYAFSDEHKERYFPERTAKERALRDMQPALEETDDSDETEAGIPNQQTPGNNEEDTEVRERLQNPMPGDGVPDSDIDTPPDNSSQNHSSLKWQIEPAVSDADLKPLLEEFAAWMRYQNHRATHQIAKAAYAKKHNERCVLYLVITDSFKAQPYDVRFHLAEALWQFWGFRAERHRKVSRPEDAFIVLLDENRKILGGSHPEKGSRIYLVD